MRKLKIIRSYIVNMFVVLSIQAIFTRLLYSDYRNFGKGLSNINS